MHLVAVDSQVILGDVGLVHARKVEQLRLAPVRGLQCFDSMLHLRRAQIITVFQLELQASRSSQSGDCRGDHCEYLCFLDAVGFAVEAVYDSRGGMFFAFSFVPVFQDHEIGPCVREFAATHDRETVYSDIGLDFRIAVEDLVDLLSDCFRTVQAGCRRELGGYQEITVILFQDESGRPAHKHDDGNGRYDPEYHHRDKRVLQHAADDVVIYFLGFAEHLVEGFEYKEFRFFVRLQEQGAQGRRKRQRVEPA